ncbi:hypothetical protein [Paracoccus fontiphilus]|uniref:Uncharacterized protein n=1 Tax=Paracoccus fontiphilus TaxID=1815556 RepID=A0ABV7ICW2_9RHOB|nr:hypothetical protein [Paracoccus fontiphilus]
MPDAADVVVIGGGIALAGMIDTTPDQVPVLDERRFPGSSSRRACRTTAPASGRARAMSCRG